MKLYRLFHRALQQFQEVSAPTAQDACTQAGWLIGDCWVREYVPTRPDRKSASGYKYAGWKNITPRLKK